MARSYERINYALRPAKNIERKMIAEALRRLSEFGAVEAYRYVGFGSTYFSDFNLFHKNLGISNMVSVERDLGNQARFEFNLPYRCIQLVMEHSNTALPKLPWGMRTILWLDYDGKLDLRSLADISFFAANALQGSVVIVTVNAHPDDFGTDRLETLKNRIGADALPAGVRGVDLEGWGLARVCRRIIQNKILETLAQRNGGLPHGNRIRYKQLFNFHYSDSTHMLTTGGLLYDEGQLGNVASCDFETLQFVRDADDPYVISVPSLTYKEIRYLNAQLPVDDPRDLAAPAVPEDALDAYAKIYRYFPGFVDAEL